MKRAWNRQYLASRRAGVFGVTATVGERANLVAHLSSVDALAERDDLGKNLETEDRRCARWRWVFAQARDHVRTVYAGIGKPVDDLARPWLRLGRWRDAALLAPPTPCSTYCIDSIISELLSSREIGFVKPGSTCRYAALAPADSEPPVPAGRSSLAPIMLSAFARLRIASLT